MYQRSIEGGAGPENASLGDKLATELVSIGNFCSCFLRFFYEAPENTY